MSKFSLIIGTVLLLNGALLISLSLSLLLLTAEPDCFLVLLTWAFSIVFFIAGLRAVVIGISK